MSEGGTIRKLKDGEIIFKEGDPSGSAFVIMKGSVELTKNSKFGAVLLAKLKTGELFGEMGVIDGSPRSATSRAVGPTAVKEISPDTLLNGIQNDPDLSSKVMSKLVERLRAADDMLAKAGVSPADGSTTRAPAKPGATGQQPKKKGFLSRLFSSNKGREATFEIVVADLFDDPDKKATLLLYNTLKSVAEQIGGGLINVRRTDSAFAFADFSDTPMVWGQIRKNAHNWLTEQEGDLLVWGQARAGGQTLHLRMTQSHPLRHDRAGYIQPCDAIDIPVDMEEIIPGYLYAMCVGAMIPADKAQREAYEAVLGPALDAARPAMKKRMRDLDPDEQVRFEVGFANLLATCGITKKKPDRLKESEETYHKALRNMRRTKSPMLEGIIKRHLGFVQSAWFDQGGEANLLEAAIETLREACEFFTKGGFPNEWADLQIVIGQLLFKKDQMDENNTALREAIAAFQGALQVYTASTTPRRWGDAKHNLARALQTLGSQLGDLDMIARSAEACREALAVRNKMQTPMLWAATQNNLGSALFMLSQKTRKPETAEAAVKAFQAALEVYQAHNAQKLAQVTEKNLMRAQEVSLDLGPSKNAKIDEELGFDPDSFDQDEDDIIDDDAQTSA
ncbi:cyclic nucleotide-binding domain-containing protein [Terasakiella sp. A23]|uniref:cyclic nucleotide-binding domain-containing protein n=1 Tax=Terasakiella sp. FCG-A23 TaxID=3080561 RepID=UPI002954CABB|nr:cyclic nucleotide-binding domain-containing protein [Terasakiella sp. A23]MDV7340505.1 cyclic nucleotide-binding domain-containing protein [Terasakiella sp. A23]